MNCLLVVNNLSFDATAVGAKLIPCQDKVKVAQCSPWTIRKDDGELLTLIGTLDPHELSLALSGCLTAVKIRWKVRADERCACPKFLESLGTSWGSFSQANLTSFFHQFHPQPQSSAYFGTGLSSPPRIFSSLPSSRLTHLIQPLVHCAYSSRTGWLKF